MNPYQGLFDAEKDYFGTGMTGVLPLLLAESVEL
jgi:hypothetical protein